MWWKTKCNVCRVQQLWGNRWKRTDTCCYLSPCKSSPQVLSLLVVAHCSCRKAALSNRKLMVAWQEPQLAVKKQWCDKLNCISRNKSVCSIMAGTRISPINIMEALRTSGVITRHASVIKSTPTQTWLCLMFCFSGFRICMWVHVCFTFGIWLLDSIQGRTIAGSWSCTESINSFDTLMAYFLSHFGLICILVLYWKKHQPNRQNTWNLVYKVHKIN